MLIGQLSKATGVSRDTIRYYEKLKLLVVSNRSASNLYKNYGVDAVKRLHLIKTLKNAGFSLREIRQLCSGTEGANPCSDLPSKLTNKIETINMQIATLQMFKASLLDIRTACDGNCTTSKGVPTCLPSRENFQTPNKCC